MMRILVLLAIIFSPIVAFAQKPELLGTWRLGFEDYGEFIFHKVERVKDEPNGRIIARICTQDKEMRRALANSVGFALILPFYTKTLEVPVSKVFYARYSRCGRSEEYWFVPEASSLDYDEIVPAEKVKYSRFIEGYFQNPNDPEAKKEFAENTAHFIKELKDNSENIGFIILNIRTKSRYFRQALGQIERAGIDKKRIQILRKNEYQTNFPEFRIVSISN
jgi:hypothetical protein